MKRVELDAHMVATLSPQTVCQSLLALNMAGVDPNKEEFCAYAKALTSKEVLAQLSPEEIEVLRQLCTKTGKTAVS